MSQLSELEVVQYLLLEVTGDDVSNWMYELIVLERRIKTDAQGHWWAIHNAFRNSFLNTKPYEDGTYHFEHEGASEKPGIYAYTRFASAQEALDFWQFNRLKIIATAKEHYEWAKLQRQKQNQ